MILILTAERVITLNQIVLIQGVLDLYKDRFQSKQSVFKIIRRISRTEFCILVKASHLSKFLSRSSNGCLF